jgi:hypothetical protein
VPAASRSPIRQKGDDYVSAAHYGVVPWEEPSGTVSAAACHDNGDGAWTVADPRVPAGSQNLVAVIRALANTWHRPFTTLELASLQSLVDPEEFLALDGLSDSAWRERIPSDARWRLRRRADRGTDADKVAGGGWRRLGPRLAT